MKKKKQDKRFIVGIICSILIVAFVLILVYSSKPDFKITKNGVEAKNLTACCVEIKDIDYFENYSHLLNFSRTKTYADIKEREVCIPEEQNILGFDCRLIEKKDLDGAWLDENCECADWIYSNKDPCLKSNKTEEDCDYTRTCSKYKFGDYFIDIEK